MAEYLSVPFISLFLCTQYGIRLNSRKPVHRIQPTTTKEEPEFKMGFKEELVSYFGTQTDKTV